MHYRDNAAITAKKSSHADLLFELFDQNNREIFSSKSTAYMVEGEPEFAFGFPPIQDSKNKKYVVVIKLLNGTSNDQVSINTDPTNLITKYSVQKNLFYPVIFLFNRLKFVVLTPSSLFALLFVPFILIFLVAEKMKNKSK